MIFKYFNFNELLWKDTEINSMNIHFRNNVGKTIQIIILQKVENGKAYLRCLKTFISLVTLNTFDS